MREIGAYEAKTHLASILDAVAGGETVVITRHGKAIARLVPAVASDADTAAVIARMKAARKARASMSWAEILEARDQGRR